VDLKEQPGVSVAAQVFAGLWRCLRDTDFIGWYREERVAGAMLTELGDAPLREVPRLVSQRVREVLRESLPSDVARRLQVHVYRHPEPGRSGSGSGRRPVLDPDIPLAVGLG
jgi:hypothetical protein